MSNRLEQYLMEPTPFEIRVGEFAGKMKEDAELLGKYAKLSEDVGNLVGSLFKMSPANAGAIINAGVNYGMLRKQYEQFIEAAPWKTINYYGDGENLKFDRKGVGILGYRLDIVREYFSNIMKNPIFKIAMQQYREAEDEFFGEFA